MAQGLMEVANLIDKEESVLYSHFLDELHASKPHAEHVGAANQTIYLRKPKRKLMQDDNIPYDVIEKERRSIACAVWEQGVVRITQMRGNFWRLMGFSRNKKDYLYPEEALLLVEKSQLRLEDSTMQRIPLRDVYNQVTNIIPIFCYLVFIRLKSLEYIVSRHSPLCELHCFAGEQELIELAKKRNSTLLAAAVSFRVFMQSGNFSKKSAQEARPLSYVITMSSEWTLTGQVLMQLLDEADGVPLLFAQVTPTGHVMLQEFTDAATSLNWINDLTIPMNFDAPVDIQAQIERHKRLKKQANKLKKDAIRVMQGKQQHTMPPAAGATVSDDRSEDNDNNNNNNNNQTPTLSARSDDSAVLHDSLLQPQDSQPQDSQAQSHSQKACYDIAAPTGHHENMAQLMIS